MLYKWKLTIPALMPDMERQAYLYLPQAYFDHPSQRFPVLYMFDGHNVFFDSDATYGTSWDMFRYMNRTKTPLIIAAVECNHVGDNRLREYSPFSHENGILGPVDALGRTMMQWLAGTFKPMIDSRLRTLPDRTHTFIAGSSMGGLMSLYAVTAFNDVFGRAACLSPSLWVDTGKSRRMLRRAQMDEDTIIYMDYGSEELRNHEESFHALVGACQSLLERRIHLTFRIVPGGRHCEASWARQVPIFLASLGL